MSQIAAAVVTGSSLGRRKISCESEGKASPSSSFFFFHFSMCSLTALFAGGNGDGLGGLFAIGGGGGSGNDNNKWDGLKAVWRKCPPVVYKVGRTKGAGSIDYHQQLLHQQTSVIAK